MARVFIPDFKASDFKNNRERFEGFAVAFIVGLTSAAEELDVTNLPAKPVFDEIKKESKRFGDPNRVAFGQPYALRVICQRNDSENFSLHMRRD